MICDMDSSYPASKASAKARIQEIVLTWMRSFSFRIDISGMDFSTLAEKR